VTVVGRRRPVACAGTDPARAAVVAMRFALAEDGDVLRMQACRDKDGV